MDLQSWRLKKIEGPSGKEESDRLDRLLEIFRIVLSRIKLYRPTWRTHENSFSVQHECGITAAK
jgi:hypothetical protein